MIMSIYGDTESENDSDETSESLKAVKKAGEREDSAEAAEKKTKAREVLANPVGTEEVVEFYIKNGPPSSQGQGSSQKSGEATASAAIFRDSGATFSHQPAPEARDISKPQTDTVDKYKPRTPDPASVNARSRVSDLSGGPSVGIGLVRRDVSSDAPGPSPRSTEHKPTPVPDVPVNSAPLVKWEVADDMTTEKFTMSKTGNDSKLKNSLTLEEKFRQRHEQDFQRREETLRRKKETTVKCPQGQGQLWAGPRSTEAERKADTFPSSMRADKSEKSLQGQGQGQMKNESKPTEVKKVDVIQPATKTDRSDKIPRKIAHSDLDRRETGNETIPGTATPSNMPTEMASSTDFASGNKPSSPLCVAAAEKHTLLSGRTHEQKKESESTNPSGFVPSERSDAEKSDEEGDEPDHDTDISSISLPDYIPSAFEKGADTKTREFHVLATSSTTGVVEDVAKTRNSRIHSGNTKTEAADNVDFGSELSYTSSFASISSGKYARASRHVTPSTSVSLTKAGGLSIRETEEARSQSGDGQPPSVPNNTLSGSSALNAGYLSDIEELNGRNSGRSKQNRETVHSVPDEALVDASKHSPRTSGRSQNDPSQVPEETPVQILEYISSASENSHSDSSPAPDVVQRFQITPTALGGRQSDLSPAPGGASVQRFQLTPRAWEGSQSDLPAAPDGTLVQKFELTPTAFEYNRSDISSALTSTEDACCGHEENGKVIDEACSPTSLIASSSRHDSGTENDSASRSSVRGHQCVNDVSRRREFARCVDNRDVDKRIRHKRKRRSECNRHRAYEGDQADTDSDSSAANHGPRRPRRRSSVKPLSERRSRPTPSPVKDESGIPRLLTDAKTVSVTQQSSTSEAGGSIRREEIISCASQRDAIISIKKMQASRTEESTNSIQVQQSVNETVGNAMSTNSCEQSSPKLSVTGDEQKQNIPPLDLAVFSIGTAEDRMRYLFPLELPSEVQSDPEPSEELRSCDDVKTIEHLATSKSLERQFREGIQMSRDLDSSKDKASTIFQTEPYAEENHPTPQKTQDVRCNKLPEEEMCRSIPCKGQLHSHTLEPESAVKSSLKSQNESGKEQAFTGVTKFGQYESHEESDGQNLLLKIREFDPSQRMAYQSENTGVKSSPSPSHRASEKLHVHDKTVDSKDSQHTAVLMHNLTKKSESTCQSSPRARPGVNAISPDTSNSYPKMKDQPTSSKQNITEAKSDSQQQKNGVDKTSLYAALSEKHSSNAKCMSADPYFSQQTGTAIPRMRVMPIQPCHSLQMDDAIRRVRFKEQITHTGQHENRIKTQQCLSSKPATAETHLLTSHSESDNGQTTVSDFKPSGSSGFSVNPPERRDISQSSVTSDDVDSDDSETDQRTHQRVASDSDTEDVFQRIRRFKPLPVNHTRNRTSARAEDACFSDFMKDFDSTSRHTRTLSYSKRHTPAKPRVESYAEWAQRVTRKARDIARNGLPGTVSPDVASNHVSTSHKQKQSCAGIEAVQRNGHSRVKTEKQGQIPKRDDHDSSLVCPGATRRFGNRDMRLSGLPVAAATVLTAPCRPLNDAGISRVVTASRPTDVGRNAAIAREIPNNACSGVDVPALNVRGTTAMSFSTAPAYSSLDCTYQNRPGRNILPYPLVPPRYPPLPIERATAVPTPHKLPYPPVDTLPSPRHYPVASTPASAPPRAVFDHSVPGVSVPSGPHMNAPHGTPYGAVPGQYSPPYPPMGGHYTSPYPQLPMSHIQTYPMPVTGLYPTVYPNIPTQCMAPPQPVVIQNFIPSSAVTPHPQQVSIGHAQNIHVVPTTSPSAAQHQVVISTGPQPTAQGLASPPSSSSSPRRSDHHESTLAHHFSSILKNLRNIDSTLLNESSRMSNHSRSTDGSAKSTSQCAQGSACTISAPGSPTRSGIDVADIAAHIVKSIQEECSQQDSTNSLGNRRIIVNLNVGSGTANTCTRHHAAPCCRCSPRDLVQPLSRRDFLSYMYGSGNTSRHYQDSDAPLVPQTRAICSASCKFREHKDRHYDL